MPVPSRRRRNDQLTSPRYDCEGGTLCSPLNVSTSIKLYLQQQVLTPSIGRSLSLASDACNVAVPVAVPLLTPRNWSQPATAETGGFAVACDPAFFSLSFSFMTDVPFLAGVNPTAENIAVRIWGELAGCVAPGRLVRVVLHETERNKVVYTGPER